MTLVTNCPNCKSTISSDWKVCSKCGNKLKVRCVHCNKWFTADTDYCTDCGSAISENAIFMELCKLQERIIEKMKNQISKYRAGRKKLEKLKNIDFSSDSTNSEKDKSEILGEHYDRLFDILIDLIISDSYGDYAGEKAKECWDVITYCLMNNSKAHIKLRLKTDGKIKAIENLQNGLSIAEEKVSKAPEWMKESYNKVINWSKKEIIRIESMVLD